MLTNVSEQPLGLMVEATQAEFYYRVRVFDESGREARETEYGRNIRLRHWLGSEAGTILKPGGQLTEETTITKLFDLSTPGEYRVELSRPVSGDSKAGIVKSNSITIKVTE